MKKDYFCTLKKVKNILNMDNTSTYEASAAMGNLWKYLQGLALSYDDRHWLAGKLLESKDSKTKKTKKNLVFPHISEDFKPSPEILALSCGPLPKDFDVEKELNNMWEEWAR